ncbi:MAG: alpha/beta hydrolase [Hydrogenophaga sp.]|jgi:arylformamidase|uniref:alpha/beta hydrolase n=1 Tax=Hydrogenophaga sp. TaxID=1904254 RepID=UPI00263A1441|nr:alpha/beta hydrolase [Hydrogenophaga sp.]MCV0437870.1 alpha/beta hydrolase [Hydrogenophaga sp.]
MKSSPRFDPAWLEREYNNRARVPEHPVHFERWARDSAVARQSGRALIDVSYGHGAGETLDVFPAQRKPGSPPAPVLVFIHGGWWRSLDKSDHSFIAPPFVQRGACVVVPNYALCPAVTIPQITLQMVQALAWVVRHIGAHGGDPDRITVVGHSAGGHLAAMMLACDWTRVGDDLPVSLVKNALAMSGLFDLEPVMHTPSVQASLHLTPQQVAMASPARLPAPPVRPQGRGQLSAVVGALESDEFLRHNRLIQQAWGEGVVPVCEELKGLNHFSIVDALADPKQRLHRMVRGLLGV